MSTPSGRLRVPAAASQLKLEYDPALPITAHRDEILAALARHQVLIVCGATGSGKTTQLPKLCLEAGRGTRGVIGHTQPRRLAARALANRLAHEMGTSVGAAVGYKVRFNDRTTRGTLVKLMTDGILLKELESDRSLRRYDTIIVDEAHERTLNIDLILGVLKQLLPTRPDLRVLVTSATINPGQFSEFFGGAPVIEVSGRGYPVEVRYRPLIVEDEDEDTAELSLPEGIVKAVRELDDSSRGIRGDTLVFLPGEKQIREAATALEEAKLHNTQVLPLFSRLSAREQDRVFENHGERRVVLATNVAETSLTVPGIRFVVDCGLARISRYSVRAKVQRLPTERISKASAEQRKGRCGREAEGICIRLYSEEDFTLREDYTPPEVLRTNLASVILRMAVLGLGEPGEFPFLDPPDTRLVNDGVRLLQELKAMDDDRRVTSLGEQIAGIPVDPRLGRMLIAATKRNCLTEMLALAAFLEVQDPRERPQEAQQHATQMHAQFNDARSDFVTVINLWRAFGEQAAALSGNQLRKWCRENFLSFLRMREWQDLHAQLVDSVSELKVRPNEIPASYTELHQAILTGFLGSIGSLEDRREYAGPRGIRFVVAPGTPLASKRPRWVVAGSMIETARVYARMVAAIDPGWIEGAAAHLVKRVYTEPHWVRERGFVSAYETVTLYGLTLASRRRVNYANIAPVEAREIFVREALVAGNGHVTGSFLAANRETIAQVGELEARIRRRDILVDETSLVNFYTARIPQGVSTVAAFESWRGKAERHDPRLLYMSLADVMEREAPEAGNEHFPETLEVGGNDLPLIYKFEPTHSDDGVTLVVPQPLMDLLDAEQLAWLVPGMRFEKVTELLRALPKSLRKLFVPVPDSARAILAELPAAGGAGSAAAGSTQNAALPPFHEWLAQVVTRRAGETIGPLQLGALPIPDALRLNIRVVDANDKVVAEGRDLAELRRQVRATAPGIGQHSKATAPPTAPIEHREWDFGDLPESLDVERNRLRFRIFPAIEDRGSSVATVEAHSAFEAETLTRRGLTRLALLALPQQARFVSQRMGADRELVLLSSGLQLAQPLAQALTWRAARECFLPDEVPIPRTREAFEALLESRRGELSNVADQLASAVGGILKEWRQVRMSLDAVRTIAPAAAASIDAELTSLLPPDFIESTRHDWLAHVRRYLKAIRRRIERLPGEVKRDAELNARVAPFAEALRKLAAEAPLSRPRPELQHFRWMIEEFRVSLFAQEMRTVLRVSEKRLSEQLEKARAEARA
ncbi:MAG: ATP-dependent RNA helicase HrpA [Gammaproteobacteria bacterium]